MPAVIYEQSAAPSQTPDAATMNGKTTMNIRSIVTAALLAAPTAPIAWASASDYGFELVAPPASIGDITTVKVRLMHLPDKKPVPDAVIFEIRFDMGPDGMPTMTAPAKALPEASEPGVYVFQIEPSMAGQWALSVAAKVQGETETVHGSVTFTTSK